MTTSATTIQRDSCDCCERVTISTPGFVKHRITIAPDASSSDTSTLANLSTFIDETDSVMTGQNVFGPSELCGEGLNTIRAGFGQISWPITWTHGLNSSATAITGTQAQAISGTQVRPIFLEGRVVGTVYEDDDARYCRLGNIRPVNMSFPRPKQLEQALNQMMEALAKVDMDFSHVVRTWLYVDKILEWYDELNEVRTAFFEEQGVFGNLVPASTGVGVGNPHGVALICDVEAIAPKSDKIKIRAVPSPLQCPALDYSSSFSRAVEIAAPGRRRVLVSGTASIEPGGATAHVGDVEKQIKLTMEVIAAILESCGMTWADSERTIAYFKDDTDVPLLHQYCEANHIASDPIAIAHADICRDDLLFELEVDAIVAE